MAHSYSTKRFSSQNLNWRREIVMSTFRKINSNFSVSGQFDTSDILKARADGFHTVLNNRPDHEPGVTISSTEAGLLAEKNGLNYLHDPMENHLIYQEDTIDRFIQSLIGKPGPVLAYCRTGTRCTILWALAASRFQPSNKVFDYLMANGFEEFDILEDDMAEQSRANFSIENTAADIPEVFKLETLTDLDVVDRSKAA